MTRLLIATTNRDKLREIHIVLDPLLDSQRFEMMTLRQLPHVDDPKETGATFHDNARQKVLYYAGAAATVLKEPALVTIAEDSGLVIDALDGEPGVRSARFLRPDASYSERFEEIYRRLAARPQRARTARFVCALAAARGTSIVFETTGTIEGEISPEPRGSKGFGYDPIFLYPPYRRTLAEVDDERKMSVAHRGHAFRKLADWLRTGMMPTANPES